MHLDHFCLVKDKLDTWNWGPSSGSSLLNLIGLQRPLRLSQPHLVFEIEGLELVFKSSVNPRCIQYVLSSFIGRTRDGQKEGPSMKRPLSSRHCRRQLSRDPRHLPQRAWRAMPLPPNFGWEGNFSFSHAPILTKYSCVKNLEPFRQRISPPLHKAVNLHQSLKSALCFSPIKAVVTRDNERLELTAVPLFLLAESGLKAIICKGNLRTIIACLRGSVKICWFSAPPVTQSASRKRQ